MARSVAQVRMTESRLVDGRPTPEMIPIPCETTKPGAARACVRCPTRVTGSLEAAPGRMVLSEGPIDGIPIEESRTVAPDSDSNTENNRTDYTLENNNDHDEDDGERNK